MATPGAIAQPIVESIIGAAVAEAIQQSNITNRLQHIENLLEQVSDDIHVIAGYYARLNQPDYIETVNVPAASKNAPYPLTRHGRRYAMLFVPPSATAITFFIPSMGRIDMTLVGGWNELALPEETLIQMTSASDTIMMYRCSNVPSGVTVVSVA